MRIARYFEKRRQVRRNLLLLPWHMMLGELRFFYPVAILIYEAVTGSYTAAMFGFSLFAFLKAFAEVPLGVFSDRIGRRKTLIWGTITQALAVLSVYASLLIPEAGTFFVYLGSFFFALCFAFFSGNDEAMLYESLSFYRRKKEFPFFFGRWRAMGQVGLALSGIGAMLLLYLGFDYQTLVSLSLVTTTAALLVAYFTVEPPLKSKKVAQNPFAHLKEAVKLIHRNKRLLSLALASALKTGLGWSAHSFMPGFIDKVWPHWLTPFYRTLQNGVGVLSFWFSSKVTDRFGFLPSLMGSMLFAYPLSFVAYLSATFFSPLLLALGQVSFAIGMTADQALQQENFSENERATMGSLVSLMGSFFYAAGSVLLGVLADCYGPSLALIVILFLGGVPSFFLYWRLYSSERRAS